MKKSYISCLSCLTQSIQGVRNLSRSILAMKFCCILLVLQNGCISYQIIKGVNGWEVKPPDNVLVEEKTTIDEALTLLGAPDKLTELNGMDLLLYQRSVFQRNRLSLGIPITNIAGPSADFSAYRALERYDTLALFFAPDGVLKHFVYEKGSSRPYLKTLFTE